MSLTKTPLSMLEGKGEPNSDVRFSGSSVITAPDDNINNSGVLSGRFDDATGTLVITLVNGAEIGIPGFMTQGDIGVGETGIQGIKGIDGTDGLIGVDGQQGQQGCQGPAGAAGAAGPRGIAGAAGPAGPQGPQGPQGSSGIDGVLDVYIQTDDPGAVGAGALWVRP